MKTLTVRQPWAWALIHGTKLVENRNRPTSYRGPLAIHAGLSRKWLSAARERFPELATGNELVFGAVIGVVDLVDCIHVEDLGTCEIGIADMRHAFGPWCWRMSGPRAFAEPIPWAGKLGFFDVPDRIISRGITPG